MRPIIAILFLFFNSVCIAQRFNALIVYAIDGTAYELNFESSAKLSFSDATLSIESAGNVLIDLPLDNVSHWEAIPIEGGFSDTKAAKDFNISFKGELLQVDSSVGPVSITLYNANGVRLYNYYDDSISMPFQELPAGIYILTIGNKSIKLCKR